MRKLTKVEAKKLNSKEARQALLSGSGPIIRELLRVATGQPMDDGQGFYGYDLKARDKVLDIITPMLQQAGDLQKVQASNMGEVLELLKEGVVSVSEAKELMSIVRDQFEMTELKELSDRLAGFEAKQSEVA